MPLSELDFLSAFIGFGLGFILCAMLSLLRIPAPHGYRPVGRTMNRKPPQGGSGTSPPVKPPPGRSPSVPYVEEK